MIHSHTFACAPCFPKAGNTYRKDHGSEGRATQANVDKVAARRVCGVARRVLARILTGAEPRVAALQVDPCPLRPERLQDLWTLAATRPIPGVAAKFYRSVIDQAKHNNNDDHDDGGNNNNSPQ